MGSLSKLFPKKDGKQDGPFELYHENGQLKERGAYKDREQDGLFEFYNEYGQLKEKGTFNMGKRCGKWIEDGKTPTYDPCPDCDNE